MDVITLAFQSRFTGTVTLNCTGLPANATRSFSSMTRTTADTTTLTVAGTHCTVER